MTKLFKNPWHDVRNQLSPAYFEVDEEPVDVYDVIEFYTVRNDHQTPSVVAVYVDDDGSNRVVGQYVTPAGGRRHLFPTEHMGVL